MAKDPIKSLEDRMKRYQNIENEWANSPASKSFIQDMIEQIRKRTRLGRGVADSGEYEKLKKIAESTTQNRKRYRDNLSEFTTYRRSNLTATGQLLDNIKHEFRNGIIKLFFGGVRRKELSGKGRGMKNSEVAKHVSVARPFFKLSNSEQKQFSRRLKAEFLKIIRGR
jgi:hypothetical protein